MSWSGTGHGIELPRPGDALQVMDSAVVERDARPRDEVAHGARRQNLAGPSQGRHARTGMDGDPAHPILRDLDLSGVQPGADLDADRTQPIANRAGAADGARRAVECREEAVAGGVDLTAAGALELGSHDGVVRRAQVAPRRVTERRCAL